MYIIHPFTCTCSKQVNSVAVTMDGSLLLSGSEDQTACVWHVCSHQCLRVLNHKGMMLGIMSTLKVQR